MPSPINFRSFLREEKKNKKEINQRITQATRLKKSRGQFIIFLSSIVRSRVTTKFPASKRAFDENGLRPYVALSFVPLSPAFKRCISQQQFATQRCISSLVGRSSVFSNFVFPRLFATRNRVFISRSRNESPAGFVVVNPPVCQVWNRDVVKIEKFDWIIVRSIRKIIRET